ncbi:MAG: hypothetical protein IIY09_03345, partial [Clostridia bacterium]|nr:hypothetical protein [Clostridia bacterium]
CNGQKGVALLPIESIRIWKGRDSHGGETKERYIPPHPGPMHLKAYILTMKKNGGMFVIDTMLYLHIGRQVKNWGLAFSVHSTK